ncbi:hypothetical protein HGRIS_014982 [Hohenbuehelia grisea]|uniref:Uncharacterized protein n=1 Tax=Hohenbuehelia grisea TaxID=104357 RepID=A0ABR3JV89_9AGAR
MTTHTCNARIPITHKRIIIRARLLWPVRYSESLGLVDVFKKLLIKILKRVLSPRCRVERSMLCFLGARLVSLSLRLVGCPLSPVGLDGARLRGRIKFQWRLDGRRDSLAAHHTPIRDEHTKLVPRWCCPVLGSLPPGPCGPACGSALLCPASRPALSSRVLWRAAGAACWWQARSRRVDVSGLKLWVNARVTRHASWITGRPSAVFECPGSIFLFFSFCRHIQVPTTVSIDLGGTSFIHFFFNLACLKYTFAVSVRNVTPGLPSQLFKAFSGLIIMAGHMVLALLKLTTSPPPPPDADD